MTARRWPWSPSWSMTGRGPERHPDPRRRAARPRRPRRLPALAATALAAGGCVRPIRLRGTIRDIDAATGEVSATWTPTTCPTRRSTSPAGTGAPRSARLRRDLPRRHLPAHPRRAGRRQRRPRIGRHPPVRVRHLHRPLLRPRPHPRRHRRWKVARCRPGARPSYCPHGRRLSCGQRHKETDACLGRPLCPDCYDYSRRRRLERPRARAVAAHRHRHPPPPRPARQDPRRPGPAVLRQGRRVPAPRPDPLPRHLPPRRPRPDPPRADHPAPPGVYRRPAGRRHPPGRERAWFATVAHPARPKGWDITWGAQLDPRIVRLTGDGEVTDVAVASYLAKYATKSTEAVGAAPVRITPGNLRLRQPGTPPGQAHPRRLAARQPPARRLPGAAPLGTHARLPRPLRHQKPPLLHHHARPPRRPPRTGNAASTPRRHHAGDKTVITLTDLEWAGRGWRTTGDALLALSAAARAREHRRVAREEAPVA